MPGSPPTSPVHGAPRYADGDAASFSAQVNAITDRFDITAMRLDTGLASARPGTGAGTGAWWYSTDTRQLSRWSGSAWETNLPNAHAASHQDGGTDALTVREAMMATGALGLAKGSFSAYRATASTVTSGNEVVFDTEELDISNWFNPTTGRFTPLVAGYYSFAWSVTSNAVQTTDVTWRTFLRKNNTDFKAGDLSTQRPNGIAVNSVGAAPVVQANGTTDFFSVALYHNGTGALQPQALYTWFEGFLVGRS